MPKESRFWCFTAHRAADFFQLIQVLEGEDFEKYLTDNGVSYIVFQQELGGNTGTLHYQGYIEFAKKKRMTAVKKILPGCWLGRRQGSAEQASDYAEKEETREANEDFAKPQYKWGEISESKQGKRSDLESLWEFIKEEKPSMLELVEHKPALYMRYSNGIEKARALVAPKRKWMTEVYIFYGNSGTGKSFTARLLARSLGYSEDEIYDQNGSKWWPGYDGQPFVICDEFVGKTKSGAWTFEYWKKVCDMNPFSIEYKGTNVEMRAKVIVFTTNESPYSWYNPSGDGLVQFNRRIKSLIRFQGMVQLEDRWVQEREVEHGDPLPFPKDGLGKYWEQ